MTPDRYEARWQERFWARVRRTVTCWLWEGCKDRLGYGEVCYRGGNRKAHRRSYELLVGPVPDGLELDHLCRNPSCVNPAHLEPVTHAENVRRGISGSVNGARQAAKTHCKRGHPYSAENTRTHRGMRQCRTCKRLLERERRRAA
jgi:hypothetical protein